MGNLKDATKTIGDREYYVLQWSVEKSMLMKLRLINLTGKGFATAVGGLGELFGEDGSEGGDAAKMESVVNGLCTLAENPTEVLAFIKEVCFAATYKDPDMEKFKKISPANFSMLFNGALMEVYKLAFFVLEVNYKDFLGEELVSHITTRAQAITKQ
ncbi:MAG: hypothetical protein DRJ03_03235 [Chloroflexi bacterium]|nr:MAG: hypothetical protein DRJ03_03235 [Chloroflexota bacterium]